jgi:hypothetical protein
VADLARSLRGWWLNIRRQHSGRPIEKELADLPRASGTGLVAAVFLVLAIAGCATPGTTYGQAVPSKAQPAPIKRGAAASMTGARLSTLMTAPAGFTVDQSKSYDSGDVPISGPPGINPQRVSCANWWAGRHYDGPGYVGYAVKEFTRSDRTTVTVMVNLYRRGDGTGAFDASMALHDRCTHFTYQDASDRLWYQVYLKPASPAGLGDRSQAYDASETGDGEVFPSEVTFIQVGDASIGIDQTSPAGSPPTRIVPPLTTLITALHEAGY